MVATMSVNVSPSTLLALMERLRETGACNAWQDISIRMPGEKHWKLAGVRRRELARATAPAPPPMPAVASVPAAAPPSLIASAPCVAPPEAAPSSPPLPRNTAPGQGWTEPERRKYRFRLEDVAFD